MPTGRNVCLCAIIWQRSKGWKIEMVMEERKRQGMIEGVMDGDTEQVTNDTVWNRDCWLRITLSGVNRSIHQQQTTLKAATLIYNTWTLICEHRAEPELTLLMLCVNTYKYKPPVMWYDPYYHCCWKRRVDECLKGSKSVRHGGLLAERCTSYTVQHTSFDSSQGHLLNVISVTTTHCYSSINGKQWKYNMKFPTMIHKVP